MANARHNFPPPAADAKLNISDYWMEVTDPENERGEYVEALFSVSYEEGSVRLDLGHGRFRETGYVYDTHHLIGATVEGRDDIRFIDRAECERILGADMVRQIEDQADAEAAE